jgi:hypothetical protein
LKESEDADARGRIAVLEEKTNQQRLRHFVVLQDKLKRSSPQIFNALQVKSQHCDQLQREMRTTLRRGFDELRKRSFGSEAMNCWASWRFGFALKSGGSVNFIEKATRKRGNQTGSGETAVQSLLHSLSG